MKRIKMYLSLSVFLLSISPVFSQSIENSLISSTGSLYAGGTYQVSSTTGETAAATVSDEANYTLVQGFQQPEYMNVVTGKNDFRLMTADFFPNPVSDMIMVTLSDSKDPIRVSVIDGRGNVVLESTISESHPLDVSALSPGLYSLLLNKSGEVSYRFVKL